MIKGILHGLRDYSSSLYLIRQLHLWKYFAIPVIISLFVAIGIAISIWGWADNLGSLLAQLWLWDWGAQAVSVLSNIVGAVAILAIGLILYKHIVMALSAPFMSPVSEKIEAHFYNNVHPHRNTTNSAQLWRGVKINLRNLTYELVLTIPILLLSLIPVVGFATSILLFLIQAYYAGFGNMDYTLERHYSFRESINFVKQYKGQAIGNGIVFMLFLLIPVIGIIIVLPLSVTAASKTALQLLEKENKRSMQNPEKSLKRAAQKL